MNITWYRCWFFRAFRDVSFACLLPQKLCVCNLEFYYTVSSQFGFVKKHLRVVVNVYIYRALNVYMRLQPIHSSKVVNLLEFLHFCHFMGFYFLMFGLEWLWQKFQTKICWSIISLTGALRSYYDGNFCYVYIFCDFKYL